MCGGICDRNGLEAQRGWIVSSVTEGREMGVARQEKKKGRPEEDVEDRFRWK